MLIILVLFPCLFINIVLTFSLILYGVFNLFFLWQCINKEATAENIKTTLNLPDKTLQFVKDHPLMDDSVIPIGDRPRLVKRDVRYTQIVVDQVRALNGTLYDVMFISTGESSML